MSSRFFLKMTPLQVAADKGDDERVKFLVKKRANINIKGYKGVSI